MIKDDISKLSENDIYSMGLFTLYSLTEIPDYRVLSELPYLLDKKSLLKVCKYYGGTTIKIPTVEELETVMKVLLIYQRVNIEKKSLESALKELGYTTLNKKILQVYKLISEVLDKYEFKHREKIN